MNNIRALRKRLNFKVSELADSLGITPKHLYDLETGKRRLNEAHIRKLSEIFDVSATEILGGQPVTATPNEPKKPKDLVKFLEQSEVMFDGETYDLDEEDKEKLRSAFEFVFWHAKQKNKRKKS